MAKTDFNKRLLNRMEELTKESFDGLVKESFDQISPETLGKLFIVNRRYIESLRMMQEP